MQLEKLNSHNGKSVLAFCCTVILITTGSVSLFKMDTKYVLSSSILLYLLHVFFLKKEWRSNIYFIRKASLYSLILAVFFLGLGLYYESIFLNYLSRYICVGLLSILIICPSLTDQILRIVSISEPIRFLNEALILYRNILNGTVDDFILGLRTSIKYSEKNYFINFFNAAFLITITLIARIAFINRKILIATHVRMFSIENIKSLDSVKSISIFIIILYLCYFGYFFI